MSNTSMALIVKLAVTFIATWLSIGLIDGAPLTWIATIAVLGTLLNYILGDLVVLPALGNIVASLGDGVMAALVAYVVALTVLDFNTTWTSLIVFAILVAVAEYFFHIYLIRDKKVAPNRK